MSYVVFLDFVRQKRTIALHDNWVKVLLKFHMEKGTGAVERDQNEDGTMEEESNEKGRGTGNEEMNIETNDDNDHNQDDNEAARE